MNYSTQGKFPLKAIFLSLSPDFCELRRTSGKDPGCLGWGLTKREAKERQRLLSTLFRDRLQSQDWGEGNGGKSFFKVTENHEAENAKED